jgi:hypothetical protein
MTTFRPVIPTLGDDVAADDFMPMGYKAPRAFMKPRPDVNLRDVRKKVEQPGKLKLAPTSFSIQEAEALVGATFRCSHPPHNLVPQGAQGFVATYKLLSDEIVLMMKWPDGSHDWILKSELSSSFK